MRFKFTLKPNLTTYGEKLPQSYLFEISEWIRNSFLTHEDVFQDWLASNNLHTNVTEFDWFCFSRLQIPTIGRERDRMRISDQNIEFQISFLPENGTEEMVRTIFENQKAVIGDFLTKVEFFILHIERLEDPNFRFLKFKTLSPIYLSIQRNDGTPMSISPETANYDELLFKNLKEKLRKYYGKPFYGDETFTFRVLSQSQSSTTITNAGMKSEQKLRGFDTRFFCEADVQLLKLAYESGFGKYNSIGFGMVEEIN